nr:hypothetical protein [Streptomyces olivoreticuli]
MHFHGYLWVGDKAVFDKESVRRARETEVPPLEAAHWLGKPAKLMHGSWQSPTEAARWVRERLTEYAPRFASASDRDAARLAGRVSCVAEMLEWGGDACLGYYLGRPLFLSLAVVSCSPNRAAPELDCPVTR